MKRSVLVLALVLPVHARADLASPAEAGLARCSTDSTKALAEAKKRKRPTVLVFCAEWAMQCLELKHIFKDAAVQAAFAAYSCAHVDLTNDDDAVRRQAERFHAQVVPTILVFNKAGVEVVRSGGLSDVPSLKALLLANQ